MSERAVCIHGHFYQPPRENPWLEAVEVQDSAYPYHDWNERVAAECYGPNAHARILDREGRIERIVDNYSRISFNFGPTLLSWLETEHPDLYEAILEADRRSAARFSGHGSALAQAHGHLILPLANRRDKETQIVWGIRDFEHRFGRRPEGMWLPETAVDLESLDLMAAHGLRFTVLAPHQAASVRPLAAPGDDEIPWEEVNEGIDPTRPYLCRLPADRSIALFFYDGAIAREIAFGELLKDGARFTERLLAGFGPDGGSARLVHVATDGETYGHHHAHGEMALAWALDALERNGSVRLTNYAEHLERHPPVDEVEIREGTSWSCAHGIERWRSDCGCHTGGEPGWNQRWRTPLREALDRLRDDLAPRYEQAAGELLHDPWAARDDSVEILLERTDERLDAFLERHARRPLSDEERIRVRHLLEIQRHALAMYTSCGWFFHDLAGIETIQILLYADRALQLAGRVFEPDGPALEEGFLERLARAESNRPAPAGGDGRQVYERAVRPARVDLHRVAAHYALSTLFEDYPEQARIFCYRADRRATRIWRSGRTALAVGRLTVTSRITGNHEEVSFAVLHLGDHHIHGGVRGFQGEEAFEEMVAGAWTAFQNADVAEVVRVLDRSFRKLGYTLDSLFTDERRAVLDRILRPTREAAEADHRQLYENHAPLMHYLTGLGMPLPLPLAAAAEVILNLDLRRAFEDPESDLDAARRMLEETAAWNLDLDVPGLSLALQTALEALAEDFRGTAGDLDILSRLDERVELARKLPFRVSFAGIQNAVYRILRTDYPAAVEAAEAGDERAAAWTERFRALCEKLELRVEAPESTPADTGPRGG